MSGPVPSNLVLLADIEHCAPGAKVRFLGCIHEYLVQSAIVRLRHDCPPSTSRNVVNVDMEHVLDRLKHDEVDVGTWINVIGYIQQRPEKGVFVQAITVWNAGNVDARAYADAVQRRRATA
ncbi:hypothetical protein NX059_011807 [Plenodomus lindquistii]|nr:hypothetical protein NX059_011807 [Plenodomus lindquistii]